MSIAMVNSWLLILFAFTFLFSVALGNILLFFILLLWLIEGNFAEKFQRVKHNPFAWAAVAFVALHLIGLLWTSDWAFAGFILKKEFKYLMIPVLMTVLRREHLTHYMVAFVLSVLLMVLLSYGLHWDLIPHYAWLRLEAAVDGTADTTPFVSHIVYNPALAFALYLLLYAIFLQKTLPPLLKWGGFVVFVIMSANMFLTHGRMGQLVFLALLILFVFQYYQGKVLKPALMALLLLVTLAPTAYLLSPVVQQRVDLAIHEIQHYEELPNSSVGARVIMLLNSFELIRENPVFGVGTGDYQQEYTRVSRQNSPEAVRGENLAHPHNVYVQEMVQFGVLGLAVLLYWFYTMLLLYRQSSSPLKPVMLAFPLFYAVIFCSDGYIMDHYLTLLFLLFGAVLYVNHERLRG